MRWVPVLILAVAAPAWADHDMLRFGLEPARLRGGVLFSSDYTSYERTRADDPADSDVSVSRLDTRVRFPRAVSFRHTRLRLHTRAALPDSGLRLPDSLQRASVAWSRYRRLDSGLLIGGRIALTSSSDRLFDTVDETFLSGTLFVRKPSGKRNGWLFMLSASTGAENRVVPGIAYQWMKSRALWGIVGPPFLMVHWEPRERWSVDTRIILLRYAVAVSYRPSERVRASVSITNEHLEFYRADRADEDDSITFTEQVARLGLSWGPTPNVRLNLAAGYAFEREVYEDDDDNDLDIDSGFFGTAGLTVTF
jgi:hypothetical protein